MRDTGQKDFTSSPQQYQIQRGDSLYKIAQNRLPPGARHKDIMQAIQLMAHENGIVDPDRIRAGAMLQMPASLNPQAAPEPPQMSGPMAGGGLSVSQGQMDQLMGPPPGASPQISPVDSSLAGMPGTNLSPQMSDQFLPGLNIQPPTPDQVNITSGPQPAGLSIDQAQMDQLMAPRQPLMHNPNAYVQTPQVGFPSTGAPPGMSIDQSQMDDLMADFPPVLAKKKSSISKKRKKA